MHLEGALDDARFDQAWRELTERHESLCIYLGFVGGEVVQFEGDSQSQVHRVECRPGLAPSLTTLEAVLSSLDPLLSQELDYPFQLGQGPLVRCLLLRRGPSEHFLILVAHGVAMDESSMERLLAELASLYAAPPDEGQPRSEHRPAWRPAAPPAGHQADDLAWWQGVYADAPQLELTSDFPRPGSPTHRSGHVLVQQWGRGVAALRALAESESVSPQVVLLAAFRLLLTRSTGQSSLVLGVAQAASAPDHLSDACGPFSDYLGLRVDVARSTTFRELVRLERDFLAEARAHGSVSFDRVVESLRLERDVTRHPIFQVFVQVESSSAPPDDQWGTLRATQLPLPPRYSLFDLTLKLSLRGENLQGWLGYDEAIYRPQTAQRLAERFTSLLASVVGQPDAPLDSHSMVASHEMQRLHEWNTTHAPFPSQTLLHEFFEQQARRTPDAEALRFESQTLSYRQLNEQANQLAHLLRRSGVGPGDRVGVLLERSVDMVVALYATLKAGAAYVPFDPELPVDRLLGMVDDAEPRVVLTLRSQVRALPGTRPQFLALDELRAECQAESTDNLPRLVEPTDIAYVIFTSGSTGRPKGVMNHHLGVVNRLWWMQQTFPLGPDDAVLQKTPYSFDVSVWEFFWPLMTGARLVVARPGGHRDPDYLTGLILDQRITTLHFVPSMLQLWLESSGVEQCTSLRRVICSGEALTVEQQRRFFARSGAELHNLYGPTEAAIDVSWWPCQRDDTSPTVPIGRPIANIQLHVLDPSGQPVPIGVPGELFIGGVGVARGYLNRPELTAERFLPDPFTPLGGRLYRTGDLCAWREDGAILYLGRLDFQVKIRGFRIELGEIEHTLLSAPGVGQAVVVARERQGDKQLVAYVAPSPGQSVSRRTVREHLRQRLPEYMVPSFFVRLPTLPLSPNGKIDRKALPEVDLSPETTPFGSLPRNEVEEKLVEIWCTLLERPTIGIHDNFFDCGGHSLLVMQMLFMVRTAFGEQLSVHSIFNAPTIAQLARVISPSTSVSAGPPSIQVSHSNPAADASLDAAISPFNARAPAAPPARTVLLTGASGFLGAYLAHVLADRSNARIYCLVRADSTASAAERLRRNLVQRKLWWPALESRLIPLTGDLSLPHLGLREADYGRLVEEVDLIVHNGALVDFVRPYTMLRLSNVVGTSEILRLAVQKQIKPVHFVSTLSVFPSMREHEQRVEAEDDPLGNAIDRLDSGYAQSKWVAEQLCLQARERGVPVSIHRPGTVLGPSGIGNAADFFHLLVKGCVQLGLAPDLDMQFNLTPADYVAPAIAHIALTRPLDSRAYHYVNPRRLLWRELITSLSENGYDVAFTGFADWLARLRQSIEQGQENALAPLLYFLTEMPADALRFPWFLSHESTAALAGTDITCTPADDTLLARWQSDLVSSGFLPPPVLAPLPGADPSRP